MGIALFAVAGEITVTFHGGVPGGMLREIGDYVFGNPVDIICNGCKSRRVLPEKGS